MPGAPGHCSRRGWVPALARCPACAPPAASLHRPAPVDPCRSSSPTHPQVDDVPGQPADARVPQIARALDVNAQQRRQLGQLRGLFLQKLGRIAAERADLNAQLAVRCAALCMSGRGWGRG